jgi:hypothetical protein
MDENKRSQTFRMAGASLLEAMVAIVIAGVAIVAIFGVLARGMKAEKSVANADEIAIIRDVLATSIDCAATFADATIDPTSPGSNCRPFLALRRKTPDQTNPHYLTGPTLLPDGSGTIGGWRLRASCSQSEQSLVIRATRLNADGTPQLDPLTGAPYDWNSPKALLFGGTTPICFTKGMSCTQLFDPVITSPMMKPVPNNTVFSVTCPAGSVGSGCVLNAGRYTTIPSGQPYDTALRATWDATMTNCTFTKKSGSQITKARLAATCCSEN